MDRRRQLRCQILHAAERLFMRRFRRVRLPEKFEQLRTQLDARVQRRIRAGNVRAELDQIFRFPIGRQRLA